MTPQERQLVADLFDRLASLEDAPRDPEAMRAVEDGLRRAPNAVYALVQTVLVQEEALKRADARIRALEGGAPEQDAGPGGFLDTMRDALMGRRDDAPRGSVPNAGFGSRWGNQAAAPVERGGGSFLGTAAAAAAGVIGGSLLMNSISSLFGHGSGGSVFAGEAARGGDTPWGGDAGGSGGDLAREAGLNDIGRDAGGDRHASLFDDSGNDEGFFDDLDGGFGDDAA